MYSVYEICGNSTCSINIFMKAELHLTNALFFNIAKFYIMATELQLRLIGKFIVW
jgi:hypothetical protein